jgi:hypothetical protein
MTTYTLEAVQELIQRYYKKDPEMEMTEVVEGALGYGTTILQGEGLKTAVIQERYLNEWSSAHTIRMYNKIPKKYELLIEEYHNRLDEENLEIEIDDISHMGEN